MTLCGKCGKPIETCSAAMYLRIAAEKLESNEMILVAHYLVLVNNLLKRLIEGQNK